MAGKKTAGAAKKKQEDQGPMAFVIQNGKYPQYMTGIVENDKDGKVFTYGTMDIFKAMRFTEAEGRKIAEECHGRLLFVTKLAEPWKY